MKKTVIHYHRPDDNYAGWGLHLWGDAIDPTEATQWATPKMPTGTDDYGVYFEIKLANLTKPVTFIVHKGDTKYPTLTSKRHRPTSYAVWLQSGDAKSTRNAAPPKVTR